jgi:putative lipoprotein
MLSRTVPMLLVLVLAACALLPSRGLDGEWRLISGTVDGQAIPVPAVAPISLKLSGSAVTGSGGCNSYGGSAQRSDDGISFGSLSQTDIGCQEPLATAERLFMAALGRVERGTRDGAGLRLSGSGVVLTFGPIVPTPDSQLVGTLWRLESIMNAGTAMSASGSDQATLRFGADGILRGSTSCGDFAVGFATNEPSARIGPIRVVTDACRGSFITIGEAVRDTLAAGATAHVAQDRLIVDGPNGRSLEYRAAGAGETGSVSRAATRQGRVLA